MNGLGIKTKNRKKKQEMQHLTKSLCYRNEWYLKLCVRERWGGRCVITFLSNRFPIFTQQIYNVLLGRQTLQTAKQWEKEQYLGHIKVFISYFYLLHQKMDIYSVLPLKTKHFATSLHSSTTGGIFNFNEELDREGDEQNVGSHGGGLLRSSSW